MKFTWLKKKRLQKRVLRIKKRGISLLLCVFSCFASIEGEGWEKGGASFLEDYHLLYVGSGVFNVVRNKKFLNFLVEYRAKKSWYRDKHVFIRPLITAALNNRMGAFLGVGLACDLFLTPSIALTPSFAAGGYSKGKSFDLGYPIEFRSAMELSWTNSWGCRFGTMFYHLSNAGLGEKNPGTEVWMFFLGIPLGEK